MITATSINPSLLHALSPAGSAVRGADAGPVTSAASAAWFDGGTMGASARIGGDISGDISADISANINAASRGQGVEQHAAQVLSNLLAPHENGV